MINIKDIDILNNKAKNAERLRFDVKANVLLQRMKEFPYYGYVDIRLPGSSLSFLMYNSNDCAVSSKIFWTGVFSYEPGSINIWRKLSSKANVIVDCGAYTGLYSLVTAFVNASATIYAFEPVSFIRARLSMNAIVNNFSGIKVFPYALSDKSDVIELNLPFGPRLFTSGTSITSQRKTDLRELAEIRTYDSLSLKAPDLIKIDAEGAEDLVLGGMELSFENKPFVVCEILGEKNPCVLLDFLPQDYDFYLILESGDALLTKSNELWRKSGGLNVLYFHAERKHQLSKFTVEHKTVV